MENLWIIVRATGGPTRTDALSYIALDLLLSENGWP